MLFFMNAESYRTEKTEIIKQDTKKINDFRAVPPPLFMYAERILIENNSI